MTTGFPTRRLGHLNIYVSNVKDSMAFYTGVCGIEEVFREEAIRAGFVSNGSRHHDVGMIQVSTEKKVGRNGEVLSEEIRESDAGLNHIAFEVDTEAQVVAGYEWLRANGIDVSMTVDHGLARSVYLRDPSGVLVEFFADSTPDWRAFFDDALARNELVTRRWTPGAETPSERVFYDANPEIRRVDAAPLHPSAISHVTLQVPSLEAAVDFYTRAGGFKPVSRTDEVVVLKGSHPGVHFVLMAAEAGARPTVHHATFLLDSEQDVLDSAARLGAKGIAVLQTFDTPRKRSLVIADPDGMPVEFAFIRSDALPKLDGLDPDAQAWAL